MFIFVIDEQRGKRALSNRTPSLRWIQAPQQARSRQMLDRILRATQELLGEQPFDDITIPQIMKRAKASVGAFYTRFESKNDLLGALYERHLSEVFATAEQMLAPGRWSGVPLATIARELVTFCVAYHREHAGLLRTMVLRSYAHPHDDFTSAGGRRKSMTARVGRLVGSRRDEIDHPRPRLAATLGFLSVLATVRERVLFPRGAAQAVNLSDKRLTEELTNAYLRYLGAKEPKAKRPSRAT